MLTVTLRATFKMAAAVGNAPTYQVLQTCANLSQLSSENIGHLGSAPSVSSSQNWRITIFLVPVKKKKRRVFVPETEGVPS